jgi:NADH:ubiquinone reductase (H+-translocating)
MTSSNRSESPRHRIVVVGGGFAGVDLCLALGHIHADITLVDRRNFHVFQPLLYQVATGGLSPGDITAPLRTIVRDQKNVRTMLGDVVDIDVQKREVVLKDQPPLPYDSLVVATGVQHAYFGNDHWEAVAPGLKTVEDATNIRARVLEAFERAELCSDRKEKDAWLRFVVVGGGPTGVELAGALGELAAQTMKGEFRAIDSDDARILLIEAAPQILGMYVPRLSDYAVGALQELGVAVLRNTMVTGVDDSGVDVKGPQGVERIDAKTILWAAGVKASPLGTVLAKRTGAKTDRAGRLIVERDLSLPGHKEILVLGDLAHFAHTPDGQPLPGVAPTAMQMGRHAATVLKRRVENPAVGLGPLFRYTDKGTMAVIGRNHAVARVGFSLDINLVGFTAWLAWLFIHIMFLVGFENRALVLLQWASYYFTRHRGARLITGTGESETLD